ncbi:2OG-Fe(II) oxygenase [Ideonella oryzae]|uniref:2OG-Fe(II) oxygenase n=1 Tax=Ideonella oryzae TaxID=2937441 RepID=A0ABT1BMH4_9BURK|nr:2OG-Fe(II) oxygenase [Ideonella oryzae]MCO5976762.1 2OG-Fe(II) oxygenase [Ideonella oryzae]
MSAQAITPELRAWIHEQLEAGCRTEDVLQSMQASGWERSVALSALQSVLATLDTAAQSEDGLPRIALEGAVNRLVLPDRTVDVLLSMTLPRVVVLGGFLSDEECDALVALAADRLARSETVVGDTGGSEVNSARTSEGMFFERGETELCERIEARIAALVGWPVSHGEGLQVLRYRPGAQYLPHHDYFDPAQPGATSILARGGQRLATLVMYLNTPEAGGATTFPDVGLEVAPIKGNAVFFSYPRPDAATRTLHGGAPVQSGEKWVATKWLRQREFR